MAVDPYYPRSYEAVTADQLIKHAAERGLKNEAICQESLSDYTPKANRRHMELVDRVVSNYTIGQLLRVLVRIDQRTADAVARDLWLAWEDGETVTESLHAWGREYGIPEGGTA